MTDEKKKKPEAMSPPTRRMFVGMIAAAAAALAVKQVAKPAEEPVRSTWQGKTRWIGHC